MMETKKKQNIFPKIAVFIIVVALFATIMVLRSQIQNLADERDRISVAVKKHQDKVDELEYEFTLSEKEYIEKYAREKLGFHKSGEIVFKDSN